MKLVERGQCQLEVLSRTAIVVTPFTANGDTRPVDMIYLPAGAVFSLSATYRHDVFIWQGALRSDSDQPIEMGSYLSLCGAEELIAGNFGAILFRYREPVADQTRCATVRANAIVWRDGPMQGVRFCRLIDQDHRVSLISFAPGALIPPHDHSAGEEIFVLNGTLKDAWGDTCAGGWVRLYPGARHAPWAESEVIFLLRNGHLKYPASGTI